MSLMRLPCVHIFACALKKYTSFKEEWILARWRKTVTSSKDELSDNDAGVHVTPTSVAQPNFFFLEV